MKYLKLYEHFQLDEDETSNLVEMIESHSPYLLDKGFKILSNWFYDGNLDIVILNPLIFENGMPSIDYSSLKAFKWSEVMDHIIPILSILTEEYTYKSIVFYCKNGSKRTFQNGTMQHKLLLDGKFPITSHRNPKDEEDIIELTIEDVIKK